MTMDLIDRTVKASTSETDIICPRCGIKMALSRYKYECPGGDVSVSRRICGVDISPEMVKQLCTGAAVGPFHFSRSSDGKKFDAKLKMESSGNLKFDFSSGIRCPNAGRTSGSTVEEYSVTAADSSCSETFSRAERRSEKVRR